MAFNPLSAKPSGSFAARVEAARLAKEEAEKTALSKTDQLSEAAKEFKFAPPEEASEALGIVFDNSSSMSGLLIEDAREGVTEFMKACTPNETAIKLIPLNNGPVSEKENPQPYYLSHPSSFLTKINSHFTCDLPALTLDLPNIHAEGGTPLFEAIQTNLKPSIEQPKIRITRMVVFSDGEPNGNTETALAETIAKAKEKKVILDTVYISNSYRQNETDRAYIVMKRLADETGGIFMVFERGKTTFKRILKYLTQGNKLLLADNDFKKALEAGEIG